MLNKNLVKVGAVLIIGFNLNACGQNDSPNTTLRAEISQKSSDSQKKIISNRWDDFKTGFKNRATVSETVYNAKVDANTYDVKRGNNSHRLTMKDLINEKKWNEFQKAFKERAGYYMANISNAFN
jgi:hypothetical protein